jgi:hypothetical protein
MACARERTFAFLMLLGSCLLCSEYDGIPRRGTCATVREECADSNPFALHSKYVVVPVCDSHRPSTDKVDVPLAR